MVSIFHSKHSHRISGLALVSALALLASGQDVKANPTTSQSTVPYFPSTPAARISTEFPIGYWLGPTQKFTNLERFQEIRDVGMTTIWMQGEYGPSAQENLKILDLAQKIGQKAFVLDGRLPQKITGNPDAIANIDAVIKDYAKHPALAGYFLGDEPSTPAFAGMAEVVAYMRRKDPTHPVFINLLPNYATPEQLGPEKPTYEEYLRRFIREVKPFVLSYDHYNLLQGADRPGFLANLEVANRLSKEYNLPFWNIVQVAKWGPMREVNEAELRYQAMQTLAYGGKGLLWFTYWQSLDPMFTQAVISREGVRGPHYEMVKRVNAELVALGNQLLQAKSLTVFNIGKIPTEVEGQVPTEATRRTPGTPIDVTGPGNLTVGVFDHGKGTYSALVTNGDYKESVRTEVMVFSGAKIPQRFNVQTKKWEKVAVTAQPGGFRVTLTLPPAGAVLLKW